MLAGALWLGAASVRAEEPTSPTAEVGHAPSARAGKPITGTTDDESMRNLLLMLGFAGACGGALSYLQRRDELNNSPVPAKPPAAVDPSKPSPSNAQALKSYSPLRAVLEGIVAAEVVPLFLSVTQSTLLDGALADDYVDMAVLVGLGLVAAVYSQKFLDTIGDLVITQRVKILEHRAQEAEAQVRTVERIGEDAKIDAAKARANAESAVATAADASKTARNLEGATSAAASTAKEAKIEAINAARAVEDLTDEGNATVGARLRDGMKSGNRQGLEDYEAALVAFLMTDKWKKRTLEGLKTDFLVLKQSPANLTDTLKMLTEKGLLRLHERDEVREERWSLTEDGQREALALALAGRLLA